MHLRDYLHDIPLKALKAIAAALKVPVEYRARIKLLNAVDRAFWDGSLADRLMSGFSEDRKRVLSLLAFSYESGVGVEELAGKMEKLSGLGAEAAGSHAASLLPLALAACTAEADRRYFCPKGIAEQVRNTISVKAFSLPEPGGSLPPVPPPHLLEDVYAFLAEAYKENIRLTLSGTVKKSFLNRVFSGSATCSDPVRRLSPDQRNGFVIEYLKARELIVFESRTARVTGKLYGWIQLSMTGRLHDMLSFALRRILRDDHTIIAFTGMFGEIPAGTTFTVNELSFFLHAWTMAAGGYARIEANVRELCAVLYHLGMLSYTDGRCRVTTTGERIFHGETLLIDDNMGDSFMVQPNFEVIAGPELLPGIRFRLELFATRKNRDMVLTYQITREGITRARERGMSSGDIIDFFERHSRTPLPQNVRFSIGSWAEAYGSVFFEPAMLMRLRDSSISNEVMHLPEIQPYIIERVSETVFLVRQKHIPLIMGALKQAGFQPELFGEPPDDTARDGESFHPTVIDDLTASSRLPAVLSDFYFPEDLFDEDGAR